jgi:hypothetical protein
MATRLIRQQCDHSLGVIDPIPIGPALGDPLVDVIGQIAQTHAGGVACPLAARRNRRQLDGATRDQRGGNHGLRLNLDGVHFVGSSSVTQICGIHCCGQT